MKAAITVSYASGSSMIAASEVAVVTSAGAGTGATSTVHSWRPATTVKGSVPGSRTTALVLAGTRARTTIWSPSRRHSTSAVPYGVSCRVLAQSSPGSGWGAISSVR